jgi:hypothetical protein
MTAHRPYPSSGARRRRILQALVLLALSTSAAPASAGAEEKGARAARDTGAAAAPARQRALKTAAHARLNERILALRAHTWRYQRLMQAPLRRAVVDPRTVRSLAYKRHLARRWQQERRKARMRYERPPHLDEFLCIHSHEGAWNANTSNGYFGGLQMDRAFMAAYGADLVRRYGGRIVAGRAWGGEAHLWKPLEQIWVAERAWKVRGFGPWPNTARACGLL